MIIIAPEKLKIRFFLFVALFAILSSVLGGTAIFNLFNVVEVTAERPKYKTVIIDAGHGGPDGGTSSQDGTLEKEINLQIAQKVNEFLNAMGVNTVMTRTEDISIHDSSATSIREKKISDIRNRLSLMNSTTDSVFVSIHQNHFSEEKYRGTQVFYSKNHPHSQILADSIRLSVISSLQPENSREIKPSGSDIYLLYHAQIPAVMVECGFLSNYEEAKNLKNEEYQCKLSLMIALGIVDFLNKTEE